MKNPWLDIPASDYEGHMCSPNVGQFSFLSRIFGEALERHDCDNIALLGCATGNGLERVNGNSTRRVTAVDINPEYLKILGQRHGDKIRGLEAVQGDLETCELDKQAYSLIFAGLVFEYLEPAVLLNKIANWLRLDGIMVAVLQLPFDGPDITETPYASVKSLSSIMELVEPERFTKVAAAAGLMAVEEKVVTLETGKSFFIGTYRKVA